MCEGAFIVGLAANEIWCGAGFTNICHVPTYTFEPVELNAINDQIERLTQFLDEAKCLSEQFCLE